ncbi:MAG: hypothetical protein NTX01_03025 [Candidatus Omnitrophica bacterium]|nr:hypothetical protein [Candidatus Omnitrophota bacterium]
MKRICNRNIVSESRFQETKDWVVMLGYPCLCFVSLLLSMCFEIAEKQLIVISLITGIRWILTGKNSEVKILIVERS